ncbi:hypothetical protein [Frankia sp. Cr2]|uniref:hypothetical protein n=1 Tax=Frankia sp. Cr2 TaxID=3073932 RepID=UPI002AD59C75|nr:hypothetical protein [Frankia sp. Cr2]
MTTLSDDDIIHAVKQRRKQNTEYRIQLDVAVQRKDEHEISRLIQKAVKKVLGIIVDVTFDIVREVWDWLRGK